MLPIQGCELLRILHIIAGLDAAGAETVLCELLEALREPRFMHSVVCLGSPGALSSRVSGLVKLTHLHMRPGRATPSDFLRLRRVLRTERADVIQGWMYHGNLMASLAAHGYRTPVVWAIHHALNQLSTEKFGTRLVIWAGKYFSRSTRKIIYCSRTGRVGHERFGYAASRSLMIPNGFDTCRFAPDAYARVHARRELNISEHFVAVGLVARVHPKKDHSNFLEAAARCLNFCRDVVFVLVGNGASRDNTGLIRLVANLGLQNHVRLCGVRSDIAAINNALDIACVSSWEEAFPMALGEAMACGTPCVATDVGDVREIIGDTGIVVPPRDAAALCAGWLKLFQLEAGERRVLGARARERIIEHYSLAAMARQYADMYLDVTVR